MSIKNRIREFSKSQKIPITQFEKSINVSNGYVNSISKGIGAEVLHSITQQYPNLNVEWLITGIGDMYNIDISTEKTSIGRPPPSRFHSSKKIGNTNDQVPFYNADFEAGHGIAFLDDIRSDTPEYYIDLPDFSGCVAFKTYGKSMQPTIESGSTLFATKEEDWQSFLELGQIYGIILNNKKRLLKYIYKKNSDHYILRSANPDFLDIELPFKLIKSIWLIHGWVNKNT